MSTKVHGRGRKDARQDWSAKPVAVIHPRVEAVDWAKAAQWHTAPRTLIDGWLPTG